MDDRTTEYRFSASIPDAAEVFLVGDFNNWSTTATRMTLGDDGRWEAHLSLAQTVDKWATFVWEKGKSYGRMLVPHGASLDPVLV